MQYSTKGIFESLPILAVAFGHRKGIEVRIGGDKACTDGKTIYLPDMPLDSPKELATLAFGFLYHETGHLEFSDMAVFDDARQDSPFLAHILNAIEDVRMEAERNARYPGSAHALADLVAAVDKEGWFGSEESIERANPGRVLVMGVLTKLRTEILGQPLQEKSALWGARLQQILGDAGMVKLNALLADVNDLVTTSDALQLARRVRTLVEEQAKEPPAEEKGSESGEVEADEAAGSSGSGSASVSDEDGQPGKDSGDGADASADGETSDGDDAGGGDSKHGKSGKDDACADGASGGTEADDGAPPDRGALKDALNAGDDELGEVDLGDGAAKLLSREAEKAVQEAIKQDKHGHFGMQTPLSVLKRSLGTHSELPKVMAESSQVRIRLATRMQAQVKERVQHQQHGRCLDGRVVHRLWTGNPRVFVRKDYRRKVNTAVQLLLDASGSMHQSIVLARRAVLAASAGIEQIHGCKVSAAAFPEIEVMKDFDEATRRASSRFVVYADGSTPLHRALVWAAAQLAVRREERKMLIVVTDGEPDDMQMAKAMLERFAHSGVEVIGIGIDTTSVEHLFPVSTVIKSVSDLSGALFNLLTTTMRRAG